MTIAAGGVVSYTAEYLVEAGASATGMVNNTATAIASTSGGNGDVTDVSDDPTTVAANDPTTVPIKSDNSISITIIIIRINFLFI